MDWEQYYATRPLGIGRTEYLKQVGHTVNGKPISAEEFRWIIARIVNLLDLKPSDRLLDLCCGNGLITKELAAIVDQVVGIDFSRPLLDIAQQDHRPGNVYYQLGNVLDLKQVPLKCSLKFNKILMYAALQHFKRTDLKPILESILQISVDQRVIVFGFVPDKQRKWSFFDTPRRKLAHFLHKARGSDPLGTWWDDDYIKKICTEMNLTCSFHELNPMLHAARYRFDVRIT